MENKKMNKSGGMASKSNLSLRKKAQSALDRIDGVEEQVNEIITLLQEKIPSIDSLVTLNEAMIELLGRDAVIEAVKLSQIRKIEAKVEQRKKVLESLLKAGTIVKVDKISEKSLVIGRESTPDGNVVPPGWVEAEWKTITPSCQPAMLGQGVGFKIETPTKNMFEVLEVYDPADPATAAVTAETTETPAEDVASTEAVALGLEASETETSEEV